MTRLVNPNRVGGSIHELSTLQGLGTDPCNVLFVSDQVMYLLANYAEKDIRFYGRYAVSWPNNNQAYVVDPDDPETEFIDRLVEDFQLQTAGDDLEIALALNNIAAALQAAQKCCDGPTTQGTGGASGQETTPSDGIDNGISPPSTTTFPTYNEYEIYKCAIANYIVDNADETTNAFQTVAWSSILSLPIAEVVILLAATFATPIPGDEIIAMVAILALWGGAFSPVFDGLEDAIDNNRQALVCALFNASDVQTAKADYLAALYTAIDGEATPGGLLNTVMKGVAKVFTAFDNLNKLFTEDDSQVWPVGSIDCSLCAAPAVAIKFQRSPVGDIDMGTGDLTANGLYRNIDSVFVPENGLHYANFGVYQTPSSLSYASNCAALPPGVSGTPQENFEYRINSGPGVDSTLGTVCNSGVHGTVFGPSFPPFNTPQQVTWVENVSTSSFTISVLMLNPSLP